MDLLALGKHNDALAFASALLLRGESPHALWNMFLWIISQLTLVHCALQDGIRSPQDIAKQTGVSFPSARTLTPLARRISQKQLATLVDSFTEIDRELKTGGYRSTAEAPEELYALLDTSIATVARSS